MCVNFYPSVPFGHCCLAMFWLTKDSFDFLSCLLVELYTYKPLFPGKEEVEQIGRIFDICGTPESDNWPEGRELPLFNTMRPKRRRPRVLRDYVQFVSSLLLNRNIHPTLGDTLELLPQKL